MSDEYLEHIGIARKSGRYPWGSGGDPYQRSRDFKYYMDSMKSKGMSDAQIASAITEYAKKTDPHASFKSPDLRAAVAVSTEYIHAENVARAQKLKNKEGGQMSNTAIADIMGTRESTVRGWLKESEGVKEGSIRATAETLRQHVETKPILDVGKGTHLHLGVSDVRLRAAIALLKDEGYELHSGIKNPQLGTDKMTEYKVLTKPGMPWKEAKDRIGEIQNVTSYSEDGGLTFKTPKVEPVSVNSKRIEIRYAEDGGTTKDGVIELRRGVDDLDLGKARYAQVRVAVDGTHYLKGMAMYADDLPDGVDVRFNTNKKLSDAGSSKVAVMKPLKTLKEDGVDTGKVDPANPFGATTNPRMYKGKDGKDKTSPLNIVNEEGDWDKWGRALSSQMLSKQSVVLAATQLGKARDSRKADLDEILSLTNPVVKKKLLDEYADSADAAAVHLKAAALPRQATSVILPFNTVRPNEVYAPQFDHGEKVVLVRHPHGGPFEIPALTVNNRNLGAKRTIGDALDAIGIHHSVAEQLSGADFDGDTVLVIPNNNGAVKSRKPFERLQNFDPKATYKIQDDDTTTVRMTKKNTQTEMGKISNLITDMSIGKAPDADIINAVRHSMVVIDAEKHGLNYKQSEKDHGISALKKEYQGGATRGAATIISRASSTDRVPHQRLRRAAEGDEATGYGPVNPKTGELVYVKTNRSYVNAKGETTDNISKGTRMQFAKSAKELLSDNPQPMEKIYADYADSMKGLAKDARKASLAIQNPKQSPAARAAYSNEVKSLTAKLHVAQKNAPIERQAQALGGAMAKARIDANPGLDKDDIKKIKYQSLEDARYATGANKKKIGTDENPLTPREWEAIQAGAVSSTTLREILSNADMKVVRELATPRARTSLSTAQISRAKTLVSSGKPLSEIAQLLGIPRSTLQDNLSNSG